MVKTAIDVANGRDAIFRSMASRSRVVSVVDDFESSAAVITDKVELAQAAVRNDKYVLVVSPFELSTEVRGELESSNRAMPAHLARYLPAVREVWKSLSAGNLGDPGLLRIHRWGEAAEDRHDGIIGELDLALWLFGERASEVYALERPGYLQTHLGFSGGGMAIIDLDQSIPPGNAYYSLSLIGSSGAAHADDHRNVNLLLGSEGTKAVRVPQGNVGVSHLIDDFAKTVQQGVDLSALWIETESARQVSASVEQAAASRDVVMDGGRCA